MYTVDNIACSRTTVVGRLEVFMNKAKVDYSVSRGEIWERLLILKDKRTRRKRVPTEAAATVRINDVDYVIPLEITSEGGVLLTMTGNNTEWLTDGEYDWDLVATVSRSALLTSTPLNETLVVYGKLKVATHANITPMSTDGNPVALEVRA
jgi:hypothetical protein